MAELPGNIHRLHEIIRDCTLCPRNCHVDRTAGRIGTCRIGAQAVVASAGAHFGEEPVLVGHGGSGTIFLAGCNLGCVFCQNWDISHTDEGEPCTPERIARMALALQRGGCENINFVTPTHVAFAIAEAIWRGRAAGLTVPIVYNCGGYEAVETLRLLEGLVDIYMPDFKYASAAAGARYSGVGDYPQRAEAALAEMYRQVGPLQVDSGGVAGRGVLVRHLVMPADLARSREAIDIVARVAPACAINVMGQYRPAGQAQRFPELLALPDAGEVADLRRYAVSRGLMRAD
ncbi:MAG: radical SAM protein [Phycisphaerae bacterium]|nr:radical SAM protein [Phycisphaerae bacterium]